MLVFLLYHLQIERHYHVLYISLQFHGYFFPLEVSNPLLYLAFTLCLFKTMMCLDHQSPRVYLSYTCSFIFYLHGFFFPFFFFCCSPTHPSFSTAQRLLVRSPQWWPTWLCVLFFLKFVAYGKCLLAKHIVSSPGRSKLCFPLDVCLEHKTSQMQVVLNKKEHPLFQSFNMRFTEALRFFDLPWFTKDEGVR